MPIQNGDVVIIEFKITLEDDTLFDSSEKRGGPIKIQVGAGQVLRNLENALIGMEKGEEKNFLLTPEEAYGEFEPLLLEKKPISSFLGNGDPLYIGKQIEVVGANGMTSPGWIRLIEKDFVIVDMNHPAAGKTLKFYIKVVETGLDPDPVVNPFIFGCDGACDHPH